MTCNKPGDITISFPNDVASAGEKYTVLADDNSTLAWTVQDSRGGIWITLIDLTSNVNWSMFLSYGILIRPRVVHIDTWYYA